MILLRALACFGAVIALNAYIVRTAQKCHVEARRDTSHGIRMVGRKHLQLGAKWADTEYMTVTATTASGVRTPRRPTSDAAVGASGSSITATARSVPRQVLRADAASPDVPLP